MATSSWFQQSAFQCIAILASTSVHSIQVGAVLINFDDRHRAATVDKLGARAALEIDDSSDSRHPIEDLLKPL